MADILAAPTDFISIPPSPEVPLHHEQVQAASHSPNFRGPDQPAGTVSDTFNPPTASAPQEAANDILDVSGLITYQLGTGLPGPRQQPGSSFPIPFDVSPLKEYSPYDSGPKPGAVSAVPNCQSITRQTINLTKLPADPGNNGSAFHVPSADVHTEETVEKIEIVGSVLKDVAYENSEPPIVASLHPENLTSHANAVLARFNGLVLDLGATLFATDNGKLVEEYPLGRCWYPCSEGKVSWRTHHSNFGVVDTAVDPTFFTVKKFNPTSTRDIADMLSCLSFVGTPDHNTVNRLVTGLIDMQRRKMNLVRLYYRCWTLIFEALAAEEMGEKLLIKEVASQYPPMAVQHPESLSTYIQEARTHIELFYVGRHMHEQMVGQRTVTLLNILLSDTVTGKFRFAATKNWPSLGAVRLCYPASDVNEFLTTSGTFAASELFTLLDYFSRFTGDGQLINEIGRVVATLLYRPSGDTLWYGHDHITVALPPFRCSQSILFDFCIVEHKNQMEIARHALYKYAWMGAMGYIMQSLCFGIALQQLEVQTRYHYKSLGVPISREWRDMFASRLSLNKWGPKIMGSAQLAGRQLGWGCVFNRISHSIGLVNHDPAKYVSSNQVVQWSDWFVFSDQVHEGTALSALVGSIVPKYNLASGRIYLRGTMDCRTDTADVYYRMNILRHGTALLMTRRMNKSDHVQMLSHFPTSYNGLPVDGLYRPVSHGHDGATIPGFYLTGYADANNINNLWIRRNELIWHRDFLATTAVKDENWWLPGVDKEVHPDDILSQYISTDTHSVAALNSISKSRSSAHIGSHTDTGFGYNTQCGMYFSKLISLQQQAHAQAIRVAPVYNTVMAASTPAIAKRIIESKAKLQKTLDQHNKDRAAMGPSTALAGVAARMVSAWDEMRQYYDPGHFQDSTVGAFTARVERFIKSDPTMVDIHKRFETFIREFVDSLGTSDWYELLIYIRCDERFLFCQKLRNFMKIFEPYVPRIGEQLNAYRKIMEILATFDYVLAEWQHIGPDEWPCWSLRPYPGEKEIIPILLGLGNESDIWILLNGEGDPNPLVANEIGQQLLSQTAILEDKTLNPPEDIPQGFHSAPHTPSASVLGGACSPSLRNTNSPTGHASPHSQPTPRKSSTEPSHGAVLHQEMVEDGESELELKSLPSEDGSPYLATLAPSPKMLRKSSRIAQMRARFERDLPSLIHGGASANFAFQTKRA